jgi:gamma-glutamylcyclotransferase (GGCT)/AIG2-like uncharacterized protein YtfP
MIPVQPGSGECDRLFVYGSLRRGFRLHQHLADLGATFETEGKVAGELFDLGEYPGARPSNRTGEWVCGELFHLQNPQLDFRILDEVEEFFPTVPERSQFIREVVEVIPPARVPQKAWIYWLSAHLTGDRQRIPSGDYAAWRPQDL